MYMKTVLITGASAGIGKETAYVYAENNYNLVLAARRKENLEAIKKDIENKHKVKVDVFAVDLSKNDSAEQLYNKVKESGLSIDILINNAGFGISGLFKDIDIEREENMLILNVITLTKLTKLFLHDMLERKSGHIVNIASTAAFQGIPKFATYAASKAYVLHFSEAIAQELRKDNIKVTVINPGATESEFAEVAGFTGDMFSKVPSSRDLAEFIFSSVKKEKISAIHGFKNKITAFSTRLTPRNLLTKIAGKMTE